MYYHAAVLLLFRPFLKAEFTDSAISPSDVCRRAAAEISSLFALYRRYYGTVGIYTFQLHCLLTACTIHIIYTPAIASTTFLTNACNQFHELAKWNEWATGSLNIIKGLVSKWGIVLPAETELALYRNHGDMAEGNLEETAGFQQDVFRSTKRVGFLNPSSSIIPKRQKLAAPGLPGAASLASGKLPPCSLEREEAEGEDDDEYSAAMGPDGKPKQTYSREQQSRVLFAPFPNQPAPLLEPIHTSVQLEVNNQDGVADGYDGISFEGSGGWFDPYMGYQGD
jgi:hypothetical protein